MGWVIFFSLLILVVIAIFAPPLLFVIGIFLSIFGMPLAIIIGGILLWKFVKYVDKNTKNT